MNRFLVIGFEFGSLFYYSLILCKTRKEGAEYRITVMNGELEKQICHNNVIGEKNGSLQLELSGNKLQDQIKTEIAKALGKLIGKPVKKIARLASKGSGEKDANDLPVTT